MVNIIVKFKIENYPFYLLIGLFVWQWIAVSVNNSLYLYINNATIIKKTNFDRKLLNIVLVNSETIHFLIFLPVLFLIFLISTSTNFFDFKSFSGIILLPFVFLFTYIFIVGISLIISVINVIFRDVERITSVFLQIVFYTSPIVYPKDLSSQKYRILLDLIDEVLTVCDKDFQLKGIDKIKQLHKSGKTIILVSQYI